MRVLAAVDKFKGSLTASEVAAHLGLGLRAAQPGVEVIELPIADGGEGTLEAAEAAGYRRRTLTVVGPTGEPLQASLAVSGRTAVVEMAAASGLALLPHGQRHPLTATSRGTGELVRAALDEGCETIVLGVGGSACTDGGAGLLQALGLSITDSAGLEVGPGGAALRLADRVDATGLDPRLAGTTVVLASDVDNPLTGVQGAPAVYGPQKGATPEDVAVLEAGLTQWVAVLADALGPQVRDAARSPGAGAAGGLGFAAVAALNGTFRPGIDVVLELTGFHRHLVGADLVITGEGSLDAQSLHGKAPVGVASAAAGAAVPVVAVAGVVQISDEALAGAGIRRAYALTDLEPDLDRCIREAGPLLEELAQRVARDWLTPSRRGDHPPRREPVRTQSEAET